MQISNVELPEGFYPRLVLDINSMIGVNSRINNALIYYNILY